MTTLSIPRRKQSNMPPDAEPQHNATPDGSPADASPSAASLAVSARKPNSPQNTRASDTLAVKKKRTIYYPTGDGKPMAEDVLHLALMHYVIPALMYRYRLRPDVHVAGNDFLYYEEGNPKARISPDCYVTFGVEPKSIRHFYKVWEENGVAPSVVFEFTSKKTKKEDVTIKRPLYEQVLRVQEYFQFDPTGDYLRPRLQGQRLINGVYQPIELRDDRMRSEQLGLEFVVEGETLRLYDPVAGEFLPTYAQAETQRVTEQRRAETADRRAETADRRAEEEALRAEDEKQRAEAAHTELRRLREELEALRRQK